MLTPRLHRTIPSSHDAGVQVDTDDDIKCLHLILDSMGSEPPGPMYKDTNKHLAEILLDSGNKEEAVYHLSESLGTTLRNQAICHLDIQIGKCKGDTILMQDRLKHLEFGGDLYNGVSGLYRRLAELPSEWTVLQLTLQWDPLSRFPPRNRDVNRGLGTFLTRFSCGDISKETNIQGEGGKPITIFLPTVDDDVDRLSLTAAMRNHLSKMNAPNRKNRCQVHEECSHGIEATVKDMQSWIGGWHCLFFGRLANEKLQNTIKKGVDTIVLSYESYEDGESEVEKESTTKSERQKQSKQVSNLSEETMRILYLLASSSKILSKEILVVISTLIDDQKLALYLSKKINEFKSTYSAALSVAKRHPVVLLIDEELDILPFEVMSALEEQSFTRMPSIHFLHAYYWLHKHSTLRTGVDPEKLFYVVNPTKDLPNLEKAFNSWPSSPCTQKWKGVINRIPTKDEVLNALKENDIYLYCGHGGGNQFLHRDFIEKDDIKCVVFLFGCSSSSLECLGGRVEMTSLFYSYLIAGSPCVVGMLWPVLDSDINTITKELVNILSLSGNSSAKQEAGDIDTVANDLRDLKIDASKRTQVIESISEAASLARKKAVRYFMNRAALVVRGLPVCTMKK